MTRQYKEKDQVTLFCFTVTSQNSAGLLLTLKSNKTKPLFYRIVSQETLGVKLLNKWLCSTS